MLYIKHEITSFVFNEMLNTMGNIIKKDGKIWLEEIQTSDGRHRRLIYLGEDTPPETPKKKKTKKESSK